MADDIKNPDPFLKIEPLPPPPPAGDIEEMKKTQKAITKAEGDMEEKEKTQKAITKAEGDMEEMKKTQKAITKAAGDVEEEKKIQKAITKAAGDMEEKKKTQKAIRKAATATVLLSAAGIMEYLSVGLRGNTYTEYLFLIALFAIFSFASAMLFLSFVFP